MMETMSRPRRDPIPPDGSARLRWADRARRLTTALLPAALLFSGLPAQAALAQGRGEFEPRMDPFGDQGGAQLFTLLDPSSAAELSLRAIRLIESGREVAALAPLRELIEDQGSGVVLTARISRDQGGDSIYPKHLGATAWATATLRTLGPEALAAYEEQVGALAERALERAVRQVDREQLVDLVRRWPASRAAHAGWIALGDLSLSEGRLSAAEQAYANAAEIEAAPAIDARLTALAGIERAPEPGSGNALGHPDPAAPLGPLPGIDRDTWSRQLPFGPYHPTRGSGQFALFPVIVGETVYVTDSLEVAAYDLYSGAERWRALEPASWRRVRREERSSFYVALDRNNALIAPAVGAGIVVAPLQLPYAANQNERFQGLVIMNKLPERRLHAFDADTGQPLWDHAPPMDWDGQSAVAFERAMHVAGPPVVHEGRVLVPCIEMQGRVEMHVACYDLFGGELIWQTQVITGQRELNMFNRHQTEYSGAPVTIADGRVLVATQLGTVASLDLFDGHIHWQSLYDQIPLPPTNGYLPSVRTLNWRNGPLRVADGLVLATPLDSNKLTAFDLENGDAVFARTHEQLRPIPGTSSDRIDNLLGAVDGSLLVSGDWLGSWRKNGSLAKRGNLLPDRLEVELDQDVMGPGASPTSSPRPLFTGDAVVVPAATRAVVFDSNSERAQELVQIPWSYAQRGNLGVGRGALVSLRSGELTGFLDLSVLESHAQAQLALAPDDPQAALSLLRVLSRRAATTVADGDPRAALRTLERARTALDQVELEGQVELQRALFENFAATAVAHDLLGETGTATERLEQAYSALLDSTPFTAELRLEVLLAIERHRRQGPLPEWEEVLARLERDVPESRIDALRLFSDLRWVEFLGPRAKSSMRSVPVDLWTRVQRAEQAERSGSFAEAVDHWQGLLLQHHGARLTEDSDLSEVATERLGVLIDALGPEIYANWSEAAEAEYARAEAEGSGDALESLPERYPFAPAAERARRLRLAQALDRGDLDTLASATAELLSDLGRRAGEGRLTREEAELLTNLAGGFGVGGNSALERALLQHVGSEWPDLQAGVGTHAGARIGDLDPPDAPPAALGQVASFGSSLRIEASLPGSYQLLGHTDLPDVANAANAGPAMRAVRSMVLWHGGRLEVYRADRPTEPLGQVRVPLDATTSRDRSRFALGEGHALLIGEGELNAIRLAEPKVTWTFRPADDWRPARVSIGSGLALLVCSSGRGRSWQLTALDLVHGVQLWSKEFSAADDVSRPLISDGRVLMLTQDFGDPLQVHGIDLFTGRELTRFGLEAALDPDLLAGARVRDGQLILPDFSAGRVLAHRIEDGEPAWTISSGPGRDLFAVVESGDRIYPVTVPSSFGDRARGAVVEVNPRSGARRERLQLGLGEHPLGLERGQWVELEAPWLFLLGETTSGKGVLRGFNLATAEGWKRELRNDADTLIDIERVRPVLSADLVAVLWRKRDNDTRLLRETFLEFYDLESGYKRDTLPLLRPVFRSAYALELRALGNSLWLGCLSSDGLEDQLEIWIENP